MVAFDFAGVQIQCNGGGGVEVVADAAFSRPRCGVARAPIRNIGGGVVGASDPNTAATIFVAIARPGVSSGLTRGSRGVSAPNFFARIGIKCCHVTAYTGFATRGADQNLALGGQPNHRACFGVQGDQVRVNCAHVDFVAIQRHTTVGVVQHQQVGGNFFLVTPEFFTCGGIQRNHLTVGCGDVHIAVVHNGGCLVSLCRAG